MTSAFFKRSMRSWSLKINRKTDQSVVPIDGIEPDVIKRPRVNGPVKLGDRLELVCQIKADPAVSVKWLIGKENGQSDITESKNEYTGMHFHGSLQNIHEGSLESKLDQCI